MNVPSLTIRWFDERDSMQKSSTFETPAELNRFVRKQDQRGVEWSFTVRGRQVSPEDAGWGRVRVSRVPGQGTIEYMDAEDVDERVDQLDRESGVHWMVLGEAQASAARPDARVRSPGRGTAKEAEMKIGQKVKVVEHADYEAVKNVGKVGKVVKLTEEMVLVQFGVKEAPVEYPFEVLEAEGDLDKDSVDDLSGPQKGETGGKDGLPDTSKPKPPDTDTDQIDDLEGEQAQVPQADSGESRPEAGGQSAGVTSSNEVHGLVGAQPQVPQETGGTSSGTRPSQGGQTAGVTGQQIVAKGDGKQLQGARDGSDEGRGKMESSNRMFRRIKLNALEQIAEGKDEYMAIGEGESIRSEGHLVSALRKLVRGAMEGMERPFDAIDVVFRREPVQEATRAKHERAVIAQLALLAEGKVKISAVRKVAEAAHRVGVNVKGLSRYTEDSYAKNVMTQIAEGQGGKPVWPAKKLSEYVGKKLIVETIYGGRYEGTLAKGPGRMYNIKMQSGVKRFGMSDVRAIYDVSGGSQGV